MADTKREEIIDALKARLEEITCEGLYRTDAGLNVTEWRVGDWGDRERPGLVLRDEDWHSTAVGPGYQTHSLHVSIECVAQGSGTAALVRNMAADVLQALGSDTTLGGLAIQLMPLGSSADGRHQFVVGKATRTEAAALLRFIVIYRTPEWEI